MQSKLPDKWQVLRGAFDAIAAASEDEDDGATIDPIGDPGESSSAKEAGVSDQFVSKDLFEATVKRIDEKLDSQAKLAEERSKHLDEKLDSRFEAMDAKIESGFELVGVKIDGAVSELKATFAQTYGERIKGLETAVKIWGAIFGVVLAATLTGVIRLLTR